MESLKYLYRIGPGPSSSHTIGPSIAAQYFKNKYPDVSEYRVTLYGSLALTGRGHLTDAIIIATLSPSKTSVIFAETFLKHHPNGMKFQAFKEEKLLGEATIYSVGGGNIEVENEITLAVKPVYPHNSFAAIKHELALNNWSLVDYVKHYEPDLEETLSEVFKVMCDCVERGLSTKGLLPGALKLERVAKSIYQDAKKIKQDKSTYEYNKMLVTSYAYAVSEENASGHQVVCAPTCGSAGIFAALLYYFYHDQKCTHQQIIEALMVGGIMGNLVKKNATISGAKGGCQAECGTACCMAAAGVAHLMGLSNEKIEYASEVAMEHHLGLTCDPVLGYVQIPCIERNGVAALRAYDAALYGKYIAPHRLNRISFDEVVNVMKKTGLHLRKDYKETSLGGLAKEYKSKHR